MRQIKAVIYVFCLRQRRNPTKSSMCLYLCITMASSLMSWLASCSIWSKCCRCCDDAWRTVVSGGSPVEDLDTSHVRTYQVYRGMSPTTSNRLEVFVTRVWQSLFSVYCEQSFSADKLRHVATSFCHCNLQRQLYTLYRAFS